MTLSLPSIQRSKSLYEQTYLTLRSSILTGELAPGERLVETQLAEKLQVSRTPIREAIRQLQRDTLVTADTGGLRVTTITVSDAAQLYDCRIALEELSVRGACQHATATQLQLLEALVVEAEQLQAQGTTEYSPVMLELDYRFHRLIAESSNNFWLVGLLEQVFDKMALLRVQTTRYNPSVLEIRNEHRAIYEAIQQGNQSNNHGTVETAVQTMQAHLRASKLRVIQAVQNLHTQTP